MEAGEVGLFGADGRPLYERVADEIRAELARDAGTGTRLPSERRLVERFGVSRVTVRAALNELKAQGVLVSLPARGWAVAPTTLEGAGRLGRDHVQGFADLAASRGLRMRSRVLESTTRPATVREAEALRTAPGATLFEMRRVRYLNDLAVAVEHNRLPLTIAPGLPEADFAETSLYALLRVADPPQVPRYADYSVEARNATAEERELLEIDGPVPILSAMQLTFNQDNEPIELTVQAYRGDRYTFHASITD
ncbi:GntR family transcriptional regulator [Cellulomonas fengjieae]|uniref:GntR family transcriptional regulator n=1 Tax=Cellulomonas fengjieae TaxID=2819978 RepID=A0ABS3SHK3_9CELL|nr:GntR family transcriptional regulator [Cellulomonas fengjieae]MBO3085225.1 GntR family transcriptional regulator [Cellulomonas fengjieae]QVI66209.1 GntR family transcriptional regulator [Cellulomonas fengjieae]